MKSHTILLCGLICITLAAPVALQAQADYENPVKKTLREGKPVVGLTMSIPSPDVAVQAASLGFDYLWIEMEHSPITLESLRSIVLATRGTSCIPFARVPVNELWTAKRVLDVGVLGVIFPFVSTPELARQAVDACRYPPLGKRGMSGGLASLRWPTPIPYADFADQNVMVIIIIEQKSAVDRIDEIAAVPGIDVIFIGPTDLSFSQGFRGRQDPPEQKEAIARVVAAARKRNIPVGRTLVGPEGPDLIKEGFTFFQAGTELGFMANGAQAAIKGIGKTPPDLKSRPLY
ncbi:MAG: aldolase [Bryobacterales bacterium]|jgi:2-keto-3-deoxy-L-rhamnonate aldolase RhmA|nr:aldolase [Bryobacterales bacterium]